MRKPTLRVLLLGLIPFFGMRFRVPFWDRIHPVVAGLPLNFFRLIPCILLTVLCRWKDYWFEKLAELPHPDGPQSEARWDLPPPRGC